MTAPALVPVDLTGPLPTGTTVLEASAGTGKTWTIAALVTRYVAEGHARLDQVLAVTFGRAATSELRTRVRERLLSVRDALAAPPGTGATDATETTGAVEAADPVVAHLRDVPLAVERLTDALHGFDEATVATTHEFCQQVLRTLGTAADLDPGTTLVEDLRDLLAEVCDDVYLRRYAATGAPFDRATAQRVASAAVAAAQARLLPEHDERAAFGDDVRAELARRRRALRLLSFDDLLVRVRDALTDPVTGELARHRLRERYAVVLVDEFQDTDPVQWEVLDLAFRGARTLVVIGDPKQAIYAFRGADVRAYLQARDVADARWELGTSWRTDPDLQAPLQRLLRSAALGDDRIRVRPVHAGHTGRVLSGGGPPLQLRVLPEAALARPTVDVVRPEVARDVAREVVALLRSGAEVTARRPGATPRPVEARDVAVLVRTGAQAAYVRDALRAAGVPVVLTGTSSVFATEAAQDWQLLLEALEQPHRSGRVRRLALSAFGGRSAAQLDAGGADLTDELARAVRAWAVVLAERGVAALFAAVSEAGQDPEREPGQDPEREPGQVPEQEAGQDPEQDPGRQPGAAPEPGRGRQPGQAPEQPRPALAARLLRRPDGERLLTDLRHVAEALHRAALEGQLGLAGLRLWLRARMAEAGRDGDAERSRRLDTDASAVQVVTIHASKGLEFPVVLVPYAWDSTRGTQERLPRGWDGERTLFVGGKDAPGYDAACAALDEEEAGEELRLLYVAVTRAVSRLVLWWAPSQGTPRSPLHRLLLAPDPAAVPLKVPVPAADRLLARLQAYEVPVALVDPARDVEPLPPAPSSEVPLVLSVLDRAPDHGWRRTSYTGLTRRAHEAPGVGSEPELQVKDDEPDREPDETAGDAPAGPHQDADLALRAVPSPLAGLPGGTAFGTLVHGVLERYQGGDLEGLRAAGAAPELAEALLPAVSTPLPRLGCTWSQLPPADVLVELGFELPLAGGDAPAARTSRVVRLGDVAALLRDGLPQDDAVAPYADVLARLADEPLRGYLGGSIDAVVRRHGRFHVVDHKTNRLAPPGEPLTAWHYRREALDEAVRAAHYPLQALLYEVALHRFLRWRLRAYDPEHHLGGVLYLFLRGMCGPGVSAGVWDWRPPGRVVAGLSDLLAGS